MKRIVFVDDEPLVLRALENLLRCQRKNWAMTFVISAEEALGVLDAEPVDVLVTDIRMPRMDGTALLQIAHARHPNVVRIVLSGHAEIEATLRTVMVAHQYLAKPCDPARLKDVVERACALQRLLSSEAVRGAVSSVDKLPSPPHVFMELSRLLGNADASMKDVAAVVEGDVALSAKLLQLVNSAFFGLPRRIASTELAVAYLGAQTIRRLVLSIEAFRAPPAATRLPGFSLDTLRTEALVTARLAGVLAKGMPFADDAFIAGLLHDVGTLVLATKLPERFAEALRAAATRGLSLEDAERQTLGVTHAEVGAYLLGIWGLPYPIVEAVAHHHAPEAVAHETFGVLDAVHIASVLAHKQGLVGTPSGDALASYGERWGITAKIVACRELATELGSKAA